MYLLWLVLLIVLLAFSIRPDPYLEGMDSKGETPTTPTRTSYVANTSKGAFAGFSGPNVKVGMGPNSSAYKVETENGTYSGFKGPNVTATVTPDGYSVTGPNRTFGSCSSTMYGCCPDSKDAKVDENGSNCSSYPPPVPSPPPPLPESNYGYCSDGTTSKIDSTGSNCPTPAPAPTSCSASSYGCCPDQLTAKVDSNGSNCAAVPCAGSTFGCCPDGLTSKLDYNGSNCVPPPTPPIAPTAPIPVPSPTSCSTSSYGCCQDQLTSKVDANGSNCSSYPSNGMIDLQPIRSHELDAYNTSTVFLSPPTRKELTCPEPQPCPPCARCPEPSFDCKKVPNYSSTNSGHLPVPILNDFSQFGM